LALSEKKHMQGEGKEGLKSNVTEQKYEIANSHDQNY
jgi:hypothetical protein